MYHIIIDISSGIIIGFLFALIGQPKWEYLRHLQLKTLAQSQKHSFGQIQSYTNDLVQILTGGLVFYLVGVIGQGQVFGLDFDSIMESLGSSSFPKDGVSQLVNSNLLVISITGAVFLGLFVNYAGSWFEHSMMNSHSTSFIIGLYVSASIIAASIVWSYLANTVFPASAVINRLLGSAIAFRLNENKRKFTAKLVMALSIIGLPLMAYLSSAT